MHSFSLLSLMIVLPLLGAIVLCFLRGEEARIASVSKSIAFFTSMAVFALSLLMLQKFDPSFQISSLSSAGAGSAGAPVSTGWWDRLLGVDGISVYFVLLSAFLTPVCIVSAWRSVTVRVREYMAAFLVLETFMIGTFAALDLVLFYVFFEAVLIPMYLIIGVWGGKRRIYASFKFFLYTLLGSVLMLVAMMVMIHTAGTSFIPDLMAYHFSPDMQFWLWIAFFASFAVKMPMWPVHTWLPDAHVEAPTAGSVILAGVLLKMGGYGFLRFSIPMFPDASLYFTPFVMALSVIAIVYTSLVALVQDDMKKMIAYSSVAHMGFVTMGIFTATVHGMQGAMFQMLSHGIISAALFLCVGVVYDRLHTREIKAYGGIAGNMPKYAVVFMILMLGSVGLPGTSGFVGEFLSLMGAYAYDPRVAIVAGTGVVLGAAYMLVLYRGVVFGPRVNADALAMPDLSRREFAMFVPMIVMVILFGILPGSLLKGMEPSVSHVVGAYQARLAESHAAMSDQAAPSAVSSSKETAVHEVQKHNAKETQKKADKSHTGHE